PGPGRLAAVDGMARMARQPRVVDPLDRGVIAGDRRDARRGGPLLPRPEVQGLRSLEREPRLERGEDGPARLADPPEAGGERPGGRVPLAGVALVHDDRAPEGRVVAIEVLRRAVDPEVRVKVEGPLVQGGEVRVVDRDKR